MVNLSHHLARALLQNAADRPLTVQEQAALEAHLAECQDCRSFSNKLNTLQGDLQTISKSRWQRRQPHISMDVIKRRSRGVAMKNNIMRVLTAAGVLITLVVAFLLGDTFLHRPITAAILPTETTAPSSTSTEISPTSTATASEDIEQSITPSAFPPSGIGKICSSTSASPQIGDGNLIWPTRNHILAGKDFSLPDHPAVDIYGDAGDAVWAADSGVVIMAGFSTWGYGNTVIIDHGEGRYTLYAHLDSILETCGQNVKKGEVIGSMGKSGNTSTPQLHFEVISGSNFIDPWSSILWTGNCTKFPYIVESGDTLSQIASMYGVTEVSIVAENRLSNNDVLTPGMLLTIPLCHQCEQVQYTVQPGDTLALIASNYGISVESIWVANQFSNDTLNTGTTLTISLCKQ